jgi:acyl-coenzyme A thioesterase PaaI-like protein
LAAPATTPRSFQRTIAAWTGPSRGQAAGAPPSSHRVTFRALSVEFGAVALEADFEDAWRGGVRDLGAGPLSALLDAAFEAAAQTVTREPLHALSLVVSAPAPYRLRSGPVTSHAWVVETQGSNCLLEGQISTGTGKILATGRATFGPPPFDGPSPRVDAERPPGRSHV